MAEAATLPKLREPEYPETHERGKLSPKQRLQLFLRQDGKCAGCGIKLRACWEADHIIELWEGGTNALDNWQAFGANKDCRCHAKKSAEATKRRAKMFRLRGIKGQRARRERRGESSIKAPPVSALSKDARGYVKRKILSRGFK